MNASRRDMLQWAGGVAGLMTYFHRGLVDAMLHCGVDKIASLGRAHVARVG